MPYIGKVFFKQITSEQSVIFLYFIDNLITEVERFEPKLLFKKYEKI